MAELSPYLLRESAPSYGEHRRDTGGVSLWSVTIANLECDLCGRFLVGASALQPGDPRSAVRLFIHPGDPLLRDDSILVCVACWEDLRGELGVGPRADVCAFCGEEVAYQASLHILEMTGRIGEAPLWQLCRPHAVELLNRFRFVDPKLRPQDLVLKADFPAR